MASLPGPLIRPRQQWRGLCRFRGRGSRAVAGGGVSGRRRLGFLQSAALSMPLPSDPGADRLAEAAAHAERDKDRVVLARDGKAVTGRAGVPAVLIPTPDRRQPSQDTAGRGRRRLGRGCPRRAALRAAPVGALILCISDQVASSSWTVSTTRETSNSSTLMPRRRAVSTRAFHPSRFMLHPFRTDSPGLPAMTVRRRAPAWRRQSRDCLWDAARAGNNPLIYDV